MRRIYDLYGRSGLSVEAIAEQLASLLNIEFEERYSDYWGGDYSNYEAGDEHVRVINNISITDDPDDAPFDLPGNDVVVDVGGSARADQIRDVLVSAGFTHLRRKVLATDPEG